MLVEPPKELLILVAAKVREYTLQVWAAAICHGKHLEDRHPVGKCNVRCAQKSKVLRCNAVGVGMSLAEQMNSPQTHANNSKPV